METNLLRKLKTFLFLPLFILVLFTSCQNEETDVTETNTEETFDSNSILAQSILNTTTFDGSYDNIIDSANCISVNLPVTVIVNGVTITIESIDDYDIIEDVFDEFDDDEDELEIQFPITIILSDYDEIVINNYDELYTFVEECLGENEDDDDIECIDFQYPITISIFDANFDFVQTIEINSDEELYVFIDDLEGGVLASINFPVTMILADGSTIEVTNNQELQTAIADAEYDCDEDDDYDYNDDDCTEEFVELALKECVWNIVAYNGDDHFAHYDVVFDPNYGFTVSENGNVVHDGTWSVFEDDNDLFLGLETSWEDLNGNWEIEDCDEDRFELVIENPSGNQIEMVIEQECEGDIECSAEEIASYLQECTWYSGTNLLSNDFNGPYVFSEDGVVTVSTPEGNTVTGTWEVALGNTGVFLNLELPDPYSALSLYWRIVECDNNRLELTSDNDELVLEQDCNNYFECYSNTEIVICDDDTLDGFTEFDLNMVYPNCVEDNMETYFYPTMADAEAQVNPLTSPYTNIANPQTIYARVQLAGTNTLEVFEVGLIVENCNTDCTVAQVNEYLMECKWEVTNFNGSDDLAYYNLYFLESNELSALDPNSGNTYSGYWNVTETETGGILLELANITGPNIQAISGYWNLVECESDRLQFTNENSEVLVVEQQECYTEQQLYNAISECSWEVQSFVSNQGDDFTSEYNGFIYTFFENEFVVVENGASLGYGGMESDVTGTNELIVLLQFFNVSSGLGNYYFVDSITDNEIVFIGAGAGIELVFARNCSYNNQDGDTEQIKDWLYDGNWEITYSTMDNQDNSTDYDGVVFDFQENATLLGDNGSFVGNLQYEVLRDVEGDLRMLINYLGQFPYWQMDDDWYITEVNENRIELHHVNDDSNNEFVLVFEKIQ